MSQNDNEYSAQSEKLRQINEECVQLIADIKTLITEVDKKVTAKLWAKKHTGYNKTGIAEPPEILDQDLEIGGVKPDEIKRIEKQPFYSFTDYRLRSSNVFH